MNKSKSDKPSLFYEKKGSGKNIITGNCLYNLIRLYGNLSEDLTKNFPGEKNREIFRLNGVGKIYNSTQTGDTMIAGI